ncbi:MAG: TolC family protein [Deltaproteobacteria bacterium]|nr:TolC family protein [Deltaproteobacteria bacterium]
MGRRKNSITALAMGAFVLLSTAPAALGQESPLPVLTLQEAESVARENHPAIRAANQRVRVQEAMLKRAEAAFYPTAGVRGSYENRPTVEGPNAEENLFNTTGQVNWLVSDFGRREGTVRREQETLEARRFSERTSVDDIVLNVRRAFFDYLRAEALVRVEQDTVKDRETLVRQARGFFEVGTRPKIDVARAEASLFAAQAGLIGAQNGVRIAWARLKSAMGVTRFAERQVASEVNVQAPTLSLDEAVKTALESRGEIMEFQSRLKAQQEAIDVVKLGRMPRVRVDGQYGRRWHNDENVVNSSLTLEFPLFAGLTLKPEIERAVSDYAVVRAQLEELRQRIALEVEESFLNLVEAGERIKANEAQTRSAKENLDLANGRYQVGVGSIIEITEAQVINTRAQTDYIRSIYDHKVAEARLARAMGRGEAFSP